MSGFATEIVLKGCFGKGISVQITCFLAYLPLYPTYRFIFKLALLIQSVLVKHWMDQVERGIVSFFKYHVVLLLFSIMVLFSLFVRSGSIIGLICHGMLAGLVLISAINLKTGESQESREDIRIWTGGATLLMFGTGALTLMIHDPNSIADITHLLGFVAVVFYSMFLRKPR